MLGPDAGRLWQVDQELAALDSRRKTLLSDRERLLHALRTGESIAPPPDAFVFATGGTARRPADPFATPGPPRPPARPEAAPRQVQNTLLTLGALLLAVAGIFFAAVTYQAVGPTGRALILLVLTAVAVQASVLLTKRELTASAEALAAVALVLAVVDAYVLRRAGLAADTHALSYAAVASAVIALVAGAFALVVPLRVVRVGALLIAQAPVLLILARTEPPRPVIAMALVALAGIDLLLASERRLPPEVRATATLAAGLNLFSSLMATSVAISESDDGAGLGLLAMALVFALTSVRVQDQVGRALLAGSTVPLVATAAWVTARTSLTDAQLPLVLAAVAMLALTSAGLLPARFKLGVVMGGLVVTGGAVATQAEAILFALAGPFSWLADPWSLTATSARAALSTSEPWNGTVITLVLLVVAAACTALAGLMLDKLPAAIVPTGVLGALSAAVLPLGLKTSYALALALLLVAAAGFAAGAWFSTDALRNTLLGSSLALAVLTATWSTADRDATLVVLPLLAVIAAGVSVRVPVAIAAAALLGGSALAAFGADAGLDYAEVGLLLLVAPSICVALSFVLHLTRRVAVEGAAMVLASTSVVLAVEDPTLLSACLGVSGLLALAVAIRPDRHDIGLLGGLLLSASSWVRLAEANVEAPEPYAAPLALTALVFGHLRRRGGGVSSMQAYGPGLMVALVPSLLKSFDDTTPSRALALLVVCVLVVLAGAQFRLRAPLAIGGAVLALDALHLLAPVARDVPGWTVIALAGAIVFGAGATYEARLRNLRRLKDRYDRLD